jgi:tRNA threonylcarbamoyladenosine biosynthesis protein TsaE
VSGGGAETGVRTAFTFTAEATEALAAALARALPDLEREPLVVFLEGALGAGKTTFARGFLRELGVTGPIRSPTYTLLETYPTTRATAVHLDLYRLREPEELETLGLRDLHRARHLWLIEWPERAAGRLPMPDVRIVLDAHPTSHRVHAQGVSDRGTRWIASSTL